MGMVTFPEGDWLTAHEAAKILKATPRYVQALAKDGKLSSIRILGRVFVERESVKSFKAMPRQVGYPKGRPRGKKS